MEPIFLLTRLDQNYIPPLQVLLASLSINNPGESIRLYLLHSGIAQHALAAVARQCEKYLYAFEPVRIEDSLFQDAPVAKQYPKEIYYRLLAGQLLPESVQRVLYLDPDILVINPLRPLWETDLHGNLFAAAAHTGKTELVNSVNQLRLDTEHAYYNSGVLLMDLERAREEIRPQALFRYVDQHRATLLLPDQDVLNALYGDRILPVEDVLWNYDARNYGSYLLRSGGVCNLPWVMEHTAVLHFCGKEKPWKTKSVHRFTILYQHYRQLARRDVGELERSLR